MNQLLVTVLTPTYNRIDTLQALYDSLIRQTSASFQWLIVDDGSTDDTEKLVQKFLDEKKIIIDYYKKENGGKHTALNYSHPYIKGELLWIVDSDDTVVPNAVETIENDWARYREDKRIAGITYLKGSDKDHPLDGFKYYNDEFISDSIEAHTNVKHIPDSCEIIRTDVFKEIVFPEYKGERFLGESYMWNQIGYKYKTVYINKVLYICTYLEGGLTKAGRRLRISCPLGGMDNSKTYFNSRVVLRQRIKNAILYDCYGFFAKYPTIRIIKTANDLFATLCIPVGYMLYEWWKRKYQLLG